MEDSEEYTTALAVGKNLQSRRVVIDGCFPFCRITETTEHAQLQCKMEQKKFSFGLDLRG